MIKSVICCCLQDTESSDKTYIGEPIINQKEVNVKYQKIHVDDDFYSTLPSFPLTQINQRDRFVKQGSLIAGEFDAFDEIQLERWVSIRYEDEQFQFLTNQSVSTSKAPISSFQDNLNPSSIWANIPTNLPKFTSKLTNEQSNIGNNISNSNVGQVILADKEEIFDDSMHIDDKTQQ